MSENLTPSEPGAAGEILGRIGHLTRMLRDGMRELGLDRQVARAAEAIPDARDRLNYIASMTERAAERALNAVDAAQPVQERLAADAKVLQQRWAAADAPAAGSDAGELIADTRRYLAAVPEQAGAINRQLLEIMMAQDFQDLTGQVIKKMMEVINDVETQLMQVLIDHVPKGQAVAEDSESLQNGPQIKPGLPSGVSSQQEADDLLASLGF
ncbi:protein phosphatase CheZ [Ramlibacter sp.]|uniref:protein phosphatase CheZ n=1 Tax=Ramlibacter sp. TaxID=1917967 RepID=UPI002BE6AC5F|nr:protein phosphatase CheZ [Ramlibacter sp.]HWI83355.1 protein phosphatase CheZ [Ramlibacter sp.]